MITQETGQERYRQDWVWYWGIWNTVAIQAIRTQQTPRTVRIIDVNDAHMTRIAPVTTSIRP